MIDPKKIKAEDLAKTPVPEPVVVMKNIEVEAPTTTTTVTPTIFAPAAVVASAPVAAPVEDQKVVVEHIAPIVDTDFDNLENQRDLAFKIVYFFIMFIIATFGLLYAYFRMDKKEQEKLNREKRAKGTFFGDIDDRTFFDFLAGHVD